MLQFRKVLKILRQLNVNEGDLIEWDSSKPLIGWGDTEQEN